VLWVHDVSDIFVDLLKMVNYLKLEGRRGYYASEAAYAACVAAWIYWRLYQYPLRVIRGSLVESFRVLAPLPRPVELGTFASFTVRDLPFWVELNVLLLTLFALHIYWGHLFAMIGYRILTESAREASRQEYEGDSDDETAAAAAAVAAAAAASAAAAGGGGEAAAPTASRRQGSPASRRPASSPRRRLQHPQPLGLRG